MRGSANPVDELLGDVLGALWNTDRPQVLIARELGITQKHLSQIRQGHVEPSLALLRRMCAVLLPPPRFVRCVR